MVASTSTRTFADDVREIDEFFRVLVARIDPDAVPLSQVTDLWSALDSVERRAAATKLLLARKVEEAGRWPRDGSQDVFRVGVRRRQRTPTHGPTRRPLPPQEPTAMIGSGLVDPNVDRFGVDARGKGHGQCGRARGQAGCEIEMPAEATLVLEGRTDVAAGTSAADGVVRRAAVVAEEEPVRVAVHHRHLGFDTREPQHHHVRPQLDAQDPDGIAVPIAQVNERGNEPQRPDVLIITYAGHSSGKSTSGGPSVVPREVRG